MATPSILSSPFLTHSIIDTLLSQSPSLPDRINLLSAKIHLYANSDIRSLPSNPVPIDPGISSRLAGPRSRNTDRARMDEMKTRVEAAGLWLEVGKDDRSAYTRVEAELGVVLDWAKGALKGIQRRKKEREKRNEGIGIRTHEADPDGTTESHVEGGQLDDKDGDETSWEEEVRAMKKNAERMMSLVQVGLGREDRAERLRRQLGDADKRVE